MKADWGTDMSMRPKSSPPRVFITGCGGMLGDAMYKVFERDAVVMATDLEAGGETWLAKCDVRELERCRMLVRDFRPDLIVHLAALTDLEFCEEHPDEAWATHALGTENMAVVARESNARFVYVSTAGVFDGVQDVYNDYETPNPLNVYGKSKFKGEHIVETLLERYFIFRAGWMMGGGPRKDKKFLNKLFDQIVTGAKTLYVVDDKLGSPTYTHDFALNLRRVTDTNLYGLYHMVCEGSCSRIEVAREFLESLGVSREIAVESVDSGYFSDRYFAPRPRSEKLVNLKLTARRMNGMRDWRQCLREYTIEFREAMSVAGVTCRRA